MIARGEAWLRWLRRKFSRNEWAVRWLRLPKSTGTSAEPGLVLIQIDGLSRRQLERALRKGRMPFLRRLLRREHYRLRTLYSGVPSTTPAVQGELFYGVRCAVPAFSYCDASSNEMCRMFDTATAARVQEELAQQSPGLLEGGSAYSNIYSGGAAESHFCAATMGWQGFLQALNPLSLVGLIVWHAWSILRVIALAVLEFGIAFYDFVQGASTIPELWKELKFIPSRVAVSVVLREFITIGASIDVTRGLPVVEVNFLGYDEQSHRRGPSSLFAHWCLKGIDDAIRRLWIAARRSQHRRYDIWIYSDHGQEHTIPYEYEQGRTLGEAVDEVFGKIHVERLKKKKKKPRVRPQAPRSTWLGQNRLSRFVVGTPPDDPQALPELVKIADMGPIGHLYPVERVPAEDLDRMATALVAKAAIPIVLAATEPGKAIAWTSAGRFELPGQVAEVFGQDHPFLNELGGDVVSLCHHPNAGQFVLSGWRTEGRPLTFPIEHGAHAGPGTEETRAFALLPADAPIPRGEKRYLRAGDLREAALHHLGRRPLPPTARPIRKLARRNTVRVMTYNVHSCVGMDGVLSTARIARVIAQCRPDIVALQELDVGRSRTGAVDQAHAIAKELEMEFHFFPALRLEEELYGDAILSRWPMRLMRAEGLPGLAGRSDLEPRGALWVAVDVDGQEIQFFNTHLGLVSQERLAQAEALLGPDWLGHPDCRGPVVLCGDLNAIPASRAYRRLRHRLRDAQLALNGHRPKRTFFSRYPVNRIDHIFVSDQVQVLDIDVPRTDLIRMASDHLPLIADFQIRQETLSQAAPLQDAHA